MNFNDNWNNHRLSEVEEAIKSKISELEDSQYDINFVNIIGKTNRAYRDEDTELYVEFTINHVVDGSFISDVEYSVYVNEALFYSTTAIATDENYVIRTRDLKTKILQANLDRVKVTLVVNGKPKEIFFNKYIATISMAANTVYYNGNYIQYNYVATTGANAVLHIIVTGNNYEKHNTYTLDTEANQFTWTYRNGTSSDLASGAYTVNAYITLNDNLLYSNTVKARLRFGDTTTPCIIYYMNETPRVSTEYLLYYSVYIPGFNGNDTFYAELLDEENHVISRNTISTAAQSSFSIDITKIENTYKIRVPDQNSDFGTHIDQMIVEINFNANSDNIDWTIPEGYLAAWEAANGSYSILDGKKWYDKTGNYYLELPFNNVYGAYGFGNEYRSSQSLSPSPDGNYLTVGYNYKVNSNFAPFYNITEPAGNRGGGILSTGGTFSITLKKRRSPNGSFYIVNSSDVVLNIIRNEFLVSFGEGFELYQRASTTSDKQATNYNLIPNDEKVNIIITISPSAGQAPKYISVYINGELSARRIHDRIDWKMNMDKSFLDAFSDNYLDIYNIYYYEYCLTDLQCLRLASLVNKSGTSAIEKYKDNNFSDSNGNITLEKGIAYGLYKAPQNSEFAVVACTDFRTDTDTSGSKHNTSDFDQTNWQYFYLYRFTTDEFGNGIIDADKTFMVRGNNGNLRIRRQGTTTAMEPTANIRVDVRGACDYYKWNSDTQEFAFDHTIAKGAKIWDIRNTWPCKVLTMKHNPNESTQCRNLPTSRWYEACARELASDSASLGYVGLEGYTVGEKYRSVLTPPQIQELRGTGDTVDFSKEAVRGIKYRQAIDGIPGIGFLIERPQNDYDVAKPLNLANSFAGQYDLITDKTNADVFGFDAYKDPEGEYEDYSIEFRNNISPVLNFRAVLEAADTQEGNINNKNRALEYRYPTEYTDASGNSHDLPTNYNSGGGGTIGLDVNDPLPMLFEFVQVCNDTEASYVYIGKPEFTAFSESPEFEEVIKLLGYADATAIDGELIETSPLYKFYNTPRSRKLKFRCELLNYVVIPNICLNALLLEWGLLIDQDTKNQFFTHFYKDEYTIGEGSEVHKVLRLLPYDMDTSWGADNSSYISHNPWELYEDGLYDGKCTIEGTTYGNAFWPLVYDCFSFEIKEIAVALQNERNGSMLTYNTLKRMFFEEHIDIYSELIYNSNALFSYVNVPSEDRATLLKKIHGSDKLTTDTFLKERCAFLQGKYFSLSGSVDYKQSCLSFTEYEDTYRGSYDVDKSAAINLSRNYLPVTIKSYMHYTHNGTNYIKAGKSSIYNTLSTVPAGETPGEQALREEKLEAIHIPNYIPVFNTNEKASNLKARGWYNYTINKGNAEEIVDTNFLDYLEISRSKNDANYYSRIVLPQTYGNSARNRAIPERTGFYLRTPEGIGTKKDDGSDDINFRVYGPYFPTSGYMQFELQYLAKNGITDIYEEGNTDGKDYVVFNRDADGLYTLGLNRVNSLIGNTMPGYGPSNTTSIPLGLTRIPDDTYLLSYQYSTYVNSTHTFSNTLRLHVAPPANANSVTYTPKITLDIRKPVFNIASTNNGLRYVDKIYCYAQALKSINSEDITTNDFELYNISSFRNEVTVLDFRYNTGEAVELNKTKSPHNGYPSSIWALFPLKYIAEKDESVISRITNFVWINGTPDEPILVNSPLNYASSLGDLDSVLGKYIKVTGTEGNEELLISDVPLEGYTLFNWDDNALLESLKPFDFYARGQHTDETAFARLLALKGPGATSVVNIKVQGYIKLNDTDSNRVSENITAEQLSALNENYPDLHIYGNNGEHLSGQHWGTLYF